MKPRILLSLGILGLLLLMPLSPIVFGETREIPLQAAPGVWALQFNPGGEYFQSDQGDYIIAPFLPFDEWDTFTLECWVRDWKYSILCQGRAGDPENSIWLSLGENANVGIPHESCGWECRTGVNYEVALGFATAGNWTHLAMVFDGKKQLLFFNGKLQFSNPAPRPGPFALDRKLFIGAHDYGPPGYGSGVLGPVRISRVARYSGNFTPRWNLPADAETVLLYRMTEGKGTRLRDASGNGNDGRIHGGKWVNVESGDTSASQPNH